ncbi:N-acetyltransferase [Paenibacillus pinisoli]|uniref:N-acetyltransferase n=2 Tax=Paenibacillus pinisoli TaxID=1276110 RepID=A0A3A6PGF1_9BACL|nr:N-acetyltransferase [Paenibacillus pinisoli]
MRPPVLNETLTARIQQAEAAFITSRISSIGERIGNPEGVEIMKLGNIAAFYIKTMPWGLFNSIRGFSHVDIGHLDEILAFYRERERRFQMDIDPVGNNAETLRHLAGKGLHQTGFQSVLYGLPREERPALAPSITVQSIENETDFDVYAGIHCVGAGMSLDDKHHFVNNNIGLLNRPGWRLLLARWNEVPAAVGVMHIHEGTASLALAATLPEYRGRGLQTALLQWRLYEAHRAGCDLVAGQASFGSSSQHNMERLGMSLAWTRALWGPI